MVISMKAFVITFFLFLFCLTSSVGLSETMDDLVKREDLYYKKFSDVPYSGKVQYEWYIFKDTGPVTVVGNYKNGKKEGSWVYFYSNGQLREKAEYKSGKQIGLSTVYSMDGQLLSKGN